MRPHGSRLALVVVAEFAVHAVAGYLLPDIVRVLRAVTGPGEHQCLIYLLYPLGGGFLSWFFPRGAPGAGAAIAIRAALAGPVVGGATAKSLNKAFRFFIPLAVLVGEVVVAVVRLGRLRRDAESSDNGA
jgi:MFS family permease